MGRHLRIWLEPKLLSPSSALDIWRELVHAHRFIVPGGPLDRTWAWPEHADPEGYASSRSRMPGVGIGSSPSGAITGPPWSNLWKARGDYQTGYYLNTGPSLAWLGSINKYNVHKVLVLLEYDEEPEDGRSVMETSRRVILVLTVAVLGCDTSRQKPQAIESKRDSPTGEEEISPNGNRYPIMVSLDSITPSGTLEGMDCIISNIVSVAKGSKPNENAKYGEPLSFLCFPDALPWVAKVRVLDGPTSVFDAGSYWVGGPIVALPMWLEYRFFDVQVLDVWLGKPSRKEYRL